MPYFFVLGIGLFLTFPARPTLAYSPLGESFGKEGALPSGAPSQAHVCDLPSEAKWRGAGIPKWVQLAEAVGQGRPRAQMADCSPGRYGIFMGMPVTQ